ncbi:ribosome biogenesis GTPase Der [Ferrovum sp.]|uniref:ribosome biogenesis GTPase Der n=1 Tax=Ferrovum sp. TaxID=2609467 RepID=UPI002614A722|nr:ribosome biogenesis GTPase Der [Ferrovum sp.]
MPSIEFHPLTTVVIVGRPNVGKSTLFNRLTRSRDALVADLPGLTRDRHYGRAVWEGLPYLVIDTGGFEPVAKDGILREMARQTEQALDEADRVIFLTDGRSGLTPGDRTIAERLRQRGKRVTLAVNKVEGMARAVVTAEFHELGLGDPLAISSSHGEGIGDLMDEVLGGIPVPDPSAPSSEERPDRPRIAIVGRPNVGKSTLVNRLLGEERVIAFDQPGTTRDSIEVDFEENGRLYTLIDTAGLRRRGKVFEAVEKFSVFKTMQSIEEANVVVLTLDARQDISDQDAHIAGHVLTTGRAVVLAVNKWEGLDAHRRDRLRQDIARKLGFLDFAHHLFISALDGMGVNGLLPAVDAAYQAAMARLPTPRLTRTLMAAVQKHQPAKAGPFRPKLRYAHQGGHNPPIVVIHGSAVAHIQDNYRRYLENTFREAFELRGTPLRVEFRQGHNPFADRKPKPLTESEENSLRRQRRRGRKLFGKR